MTDEELLKEVSPWPWAWGGDLVSHGDYISHEVCDNNKHCLCDFDGDACSKEQNFLNAQLAARAPELLAENIKLKKEIEDLVKCIEESIEASK